MSPELKPSVFDEEEIPEVGYDHASLALMPFVATNNVERSDDPATIRLQVTVDGQPRRISYTMIPGGEVGLPTQSDQVVFLALLQRWLAGPAASEVSFERRELLQTIGWDVGGRGYQQLHDALQRISRMTIRHETTVVSRNGREYRKGIGEAHLIDRWWLDDDDKTGWVEWGGLVTEARAVGDIKRLDWGLLLRLEDPIARQLYRLVDRATLAGQTEWQVRWRTLATLCGLSPDGCARPAKLKQRLGPRLDRLVEEGVLDRWSYERGGEFVLFVRNYLRARLRSALVDAGVFPEAARQLVAGFDEVQIIVQLDCLAHGNRGAVGAPGGYLVEAIRQGYDLRYPDDDAAKVAGLLGVLSDEERHAYHAAALRLCGAGDDLLATREDPSAWPVEFRAVVRWLVCQGLDPEQIIHRPAVAEG